MSSRNRQRLASHAATAALAVLASRAAAQNPPQQTLSRGITTEYRASGLSAWPYAIGGNSNSLVLNPVLLGPSWSGSKSFGGFIDPVIPAINWGLFTTPAVHLGKTGAQVQFSGAFDVGIRVSPYFTGGTLDYDYKATVYVNHDRFPVPGRATTVTTGFSTSGLSSMTPTAPNFGAGFRAIANVSGFADTEAWAVGHKLFGGTVFNFSNKGGEKDLGTFDFSTNQGIQSLFNTLNTATSLINPTPIGVSVYKPNLVPGAPTVASDGTLTSTGFGKFLSLSTSLLDWILVLIPNETAKNLIGFTQGDYDVPGTNYSVNWGIAKTNANMDVGLYGKYQLKPKPSISLEIRNAKTNQSPQAADANGNGIFSNGQPVLLAASVPSTAKFIMPAEGVTVTPVLTCDFTFTNLLGLGIGGSIGFYPFSGGATGDLGVNVGVNTSVDFQFDVARLEKVFDPVNSTKIIDRTFDLPLQTDRVHRLSPVGLIAYDGTNLPNELQFGSDIGIANLPAYVTDSDKDYRTLYVAPSSFESRRFFIGNGGAVVSASMTGPDGTVTQLYTGGLDDLSLQLQIPNAGTQFKRGIYNVKLSVHAKNDSGVFVDKIYNFPLQSYGLSPIIDGQFNTAADLDATTVTNRVDDKGTDQKIYVGARHIFKDTQMVIDGSIVVKTDQTADQDVTGRAYIGFTLPAGLVKELGGAAHTFQLRTPPTGSRPDGTSYNPGYSAVQTLYFVAGRPTITGVTPDDGSVMGESDVWVTLKGTNFSRATTANLSTGTSSFQVLESSYGTPTQMRVKLQGATIRNFYDKASQTFPIYLSTPVASVPAGNNNQPPVLSGGTSSTANLTLKYGTPSVTTLDPARLVRNQSLDSGVAPTLRVTGDNLYRSTTQASKGTVFVVDGKQIPNASLTYPSGSDLIVPYVDVRLDGIQAPTKNGTYDVFADNNGQRSLRAQFVTENGKPTLSSLIRTTFRVGPDYSYSATVFGAPFYSGPGGTTQFLLNGSVVPFDYVNTSSARLNLTYDLLKTIKANNVTLTAFNPTPGGGTSDASLNVTLEEGDPSTVKVVPGALVFDRPTNTYKQSFAVTYLGSRNVARGARIMFPSLRAGGATLLNADGKVIRTPYLNTSLVPRRQVTIIAVFQKNGTGAINSETVVDFAY